MSEHANPFGKVGYNELSPYVQELLQNGGGGGTKPGGVAIKSVKSYVTEGEWVEDDGIYSKTLVHNLDQEAIIVSCTSNNRSVFIPYDIIDSNTIKLWSDEKIAISIIIVDVINSTGNTNAGTSSGKTVAVTSAEFTDDTETGLKKAIVNHGLNTSSIMISAINSNRRSQFLPYDILSENSIVIYSEVETDVIVCILPT